MGSDIQGSPKPAPRMSQSWEVPNQTPWGLTSQEVLHPSPVRSQPRGVSDPAQGGPAPSPLTVCLKPTAVCCGALRRALVMVRRASEYSSWMALIRPAPTRGGWGKPPSESNPTYTDGAPNPAWKPHLQLLKEVLGGTGALGVGCQEPGQAPSPSHLCSTDTEPTRCCWPARGTRTWRRASRPGRRGCSGGNSSGAGSGAWPGRRRRGAAWPCGAGRAGSCRVGQGVSKEGGKQGDHIQGQPPAGPIPPPDHIEFVQEFVDPGVVIVTLGHHQVQGPAVLGADLLHQVIGHLLSLQEGKGGQSRGIDPGRGRDHPGCGAEPGAAPKH